MGLIAGPVAQPIVRPVVGGWRTLSRRFADILKGRTAIAYDPQDLTTMYQDSQGTLPVYRPGSGRVDPPVGLLLDKSKGLELGPELLTEAQTTFSGGWIATGLSTISDGVARIYSPVGEYTEIKTSNNIVAKKSVFLVRVYVSNYVSGTAGTVNGSTVYPLSFGECVFVLNTPERLDVVFKRVAAPTDISLSSISIREIKGYHAYQTTPTARPALSGRYNLLTATETLSTQSITTAATTYTLRFEGTGTVTLSGTATGVKSAGTHTVTCTAGSLTLTVAGSVTRAYLRVKRDGSRLPPYQRVDSATTYDTVGFPLYLQRDRVDDDLIVQAPAITGVLGWGTPDGTVVGNGIIAAGEYHPLAETITTGLPEITKIVAIDGTLTASEQAVLERYLAMTSPGQPVISPAAEAVFSFGLTSVSSFSFTLQTKDNYSPVLVDWGDGHMSAHVGIADQTAAHTYAAIGTYAVKVYAEDDSVLTKFRTTDVGMSGTLSLPSSMTYFACSGSNTLSGTLSLPSGMTNFVCSGSNTLSGTLSLPSGMTDFICTGSNTLSGTLSLPSDMTYFNCIGSNTLSGTLSFPSKIRFFACQGSNTLSGTLSLPSGMTDFICIGSNTINGTLSLPSGMANFFCSGSNTLSGTLSLPSSMTNFVCSGSNTLSGYTPSAKASNQKRFQLTGANTMSATDVDNILIDYAAAGGTWADPKEITIQGGAANRTSASDAAYASLAAKLTTLSVD